MWIVQKSFEIGGRALSVGEELEGMEARDVLGPDAAPFLEDGRIARAHQAPKTTAQPTPEPPPAPVPEVVSEVVEPEPKPAAKPKAKDPKPAPAGLFSRSKKKTGKK